MIVFDLSCQDGHRFEGWFSSSTDFASQQERGFVTCPECGCTRVNKAPMAPAVPRKGNQQAMAVPAQSEHASSAAGGLVAGQAPSPVPNAAPGPPPSPEVIAALEKLAMIQSEALKTSKWVGEDFAKESRAMHYGEREEEVIHGKATPKQAQELQEEGITIAPLPFPVTPPDELN